MSFHFRLRLVFHIAVLSFFDFEFYVSVRKSMSIQVDVFNYPIHARSVLQDPAILPDNVYNMDETGVMLAMLRVC